MCAGPVGRPYTDCGGHDSLVLYRIQVLFLKQGLMYADLE